MSDHRSSHKKRPIGVSLLAIFVYVVGLVTIVRGLEYIGTVTIGIFRSPSWAAGNELILGLFWVIVGLLIMVIGTGLWRLKWIAWGLTTGFTVVSLIITSSGLPGTWLRFGLYLILLIFLLVEQKHF